MLEHLPHYDCPQLQVIIYIRVCVCARVTVAQPQENLSRLKTSMGEGGW